MPSYNQMLDMSSELRLNEHKRRETIENARSMSSLILADSRATSNSTPLEAYGLVDKPLSIRVGFGGAWV